MEVESDDDYERLSDVGISDSDENDFAEALHETPRSTPPAPAPSTALIPSRTKRFHCSWDGCSKSFVRHSRLDEHIRSHTNTRPFTCPYDGCTKAYLRDSHLKAHIKGAHTHEKDYKCTWEGCDKCFATGQRLKNHLKAHEGRQKYKCTGYDGCTETFRKKETLKRHVVSVHEKRKPFPCPDIDSMTGEKCIKEFDTAQKLRGHQKTNHDETRFSCTECLAANTSALLVASEEDPPVLKKAYFARMEELQLHNAEFHPPTCPRCQTSFDTQRQLNAHLELIHDVVPASANTKAYKERAKCPYPDCDKSFTKRGNLNVHIRSTHEKSLKFICGQTQVALKQDEFPTHTLITGCGKSFSSKQVLEDHIRTAHLGLQSLQVRRKRRFARQEDKKAKRARIGNGSLGHGDAASANVFHEIPDFVWPAIGYDMSDDEGDVMDLSESMSMLGSRIFHRGNTYHYPSGEYPSSSNSLELDPAPYQPAAEKIEDGFFGKLDDFQDIGNLDPRLLAASGHQGPTS